MKKRAIKRLAVALALTLSVVLFGGCGNTSSSTPTSADSASTASSATSSAASAPESSTPASTSSEPTLIGTPINKMNIDVYAYTNDLICGKPLRGVVVDFHGLNQGADMIASANELAGRCASNRILYIMPYDNPWSWMNDSAIRYTDEILDAVFDKYNLAEDTPVVTCGGSMGGLSSLVYARLGKYTPVACAALCPVTDIATAYADRWLYQAYMHYDGDIIEAVTSASPQQQAANMPQIPYLIAHGDADMQVNKQMNSDRFVAELRKTHNDVTYVEIPGAGHCELFGDYKEQYYNFILTHAAP